MLMKIWSGEIDADVVAHVETCESCRREMKEVETIMSGMGSYNEVPTPSRSLLPSDELIRSTVRKNRIRRFLRSSSFAAGLTIILGTGAGLGLHKWKQVADAPKSAMDAKTAQTAQTANGMDVAFGNAGSQSAPIYDRNRVATYKNVAPTLPEANTAKLADVAWIEVQAGAEQPQACQAIAHYLSTVFPMSDIQHVEILNFHPEGKVEQGMAGTVQLDLVLQQDVETSYKQGKQEAEVRLASDSNGELHVEGFVLK